MFSYKSRDPPKCHWNCRRLPLNSLPAQLKEMLVEKLPISSCTLLMKVNKRLRRFLIQCDLFRKRKIQKIRLTSYRSNTIFVEIRDDDSLANQIAIFYNFNNQFVEVEGAKVCRSENGVCVPKNPLPNLLKSIKYCECLSVDEWLQHSILPLHIAFAKVFEFTPQGSLSVSLRRHQSIITTMKSLWLWFSSCDHFKKAIREIFAKEENGTEALLSTAIPPPDCSGHVSYSSDSCTWDILRGNDEIARVDEEDRRNGILDEYNEHRWMNKEWLEKKSDFISRDMRELR
ncbi:unnamed protein product, partial [Mesorhabditis belari]|uniref:F-box domain-containing protein n=1 Tax=Mesorhabditis belari TaxID=2138241 RepID=A0AAF3EKB9_9BILA